MAEKKIREKKLLQNLTAEHASLLSTKGSADTVKHIQKHSTLKNFRTLDFDDQFYERTGNFALIIIASLLSLLSRLSVCTPLRVYDWSSYDCATINY